MKICVFVQDALRLVPTYLRGSRVPQGPQILLTNFLEVIYVFFSSPFSRSNRSKNYTLVLVEHLMGCTVARSIHSTTADVVIDFVTE